jgi:HSP20 family molecular chaperone IbpA
MLNPFRYNQPSLVDWPRYLLTDQFIQLPHSLSLEAQMPDMKETETAYQYACACPLPPAASMRMPSADQRVLTGLLPICLQGARGRRRHQARRHSGSRLLPAANERSRLRAKILAAVLTCRAADPQVTLDRGILRIKGESKGSKDGVEWHRRIEKSVQLPETLIDADKVEATNEHGMLHVTVPKLQIQQQTPRSIPVTVKNLK